MAVHLSLLVDLVRRLAVRPRGVPHPDGIGLVLVLVRLSGTLQRVNTALDGVVGEVVPMLGKVSTSLDHVNDELEKVGHITDSAVDATDKVDSAVRAVSDAVQKPARAAAGFTEGVSHAFETFRAKRDRRGGVV